MQQHLSCRKGLLDCHNLSVISHMCVCTVLLVRSEMSDGGGRCGAVDLLVQLLQHHVVEGKPRDDVTALYMQLVPTVIEAFQVSRFCLFVSLRVYS
jgi:hypothetical protein